MAAAHVRVLDQRVVGMPSDVVVPGGEVDVVHPERVAVHVHGVGVVRAAVVGFALAFGRRIEHLARRTGVSTRGTPSNCEHQSASDPTRMGMGAAHGVHGVGMAVRTP